MPFTPAGATRMLDALLTGDLYAHLHTDEPVTAANVVTGTAYAGRQITGRFNAETAIGIRRRVNHEPVQFPTPGGAWTAAGALGIWDRANITPNPGDPPEIIRSMRLTASVTAALNDHLEFAAGAIVIEVEVVE